MSLSNYFEVDFANKETGSLKAVCRYCVSSFSNNNRSYLNLTTHHKVSKYENCFSNVVIIGNNIFSTLESFSWNLIEIYL